MVADTLSEGQLAALEEAALSNAVKHGGRADVGAVIGRVLGAFPELRDKAALVSKEARATVQRVNGMAPEERAKALSQKFPGAGDEKERPGRVGLPPLPNAVKGSAAFRLPPEPSGFMTIGHAMAFTINYLYKEQYEGELWLRFEDTNPRKVHPKYYENFRKGIEWLSITVEHEKNVSDDLEVIYDHGRRLLEQGSAYACSCDEEKVKRLRFDGTPCEHRDGPVDRNLRIWEELLAKKHEEGSYVIRFKGDMQSPDYSLRDSNLFRVIGHPHPLTGTRYSLWPTYDIANAVEDEMCGITHVLRSSEFRSELQQLLRDALKFRHVEVIQFSRFNFKGTPVGKRLIRPLVESGQVSGWDDPRVPTVDGLRRRGILPEAIRDFTVHVGYTKTEHEYDWSMLLSLNRKLLDPVSKRFFFVPEPVSLAVEGAPEREAKIPYHPTKDMGERTIRTAGSFFVPSADLDKMNVGTVFRLMDLYNVELTSVLPRPSAKYVGDELIPDTRKLQWVTAEHAEVSVSVPGPLYKEDGSFNDESLRVIEGYAEHATEDLKAGEVVQFPRFGFCRLDSSREFILSG